MSDTDTNTVEEKKKQSLGETNFTPAQSFFADIGFQLLHLGIIVLTGGVMLYNCKVAQANIMPTDLDCAPYAGGKIPEIAKTLINIDVVKTADDIKSTKIFFQTAENIEVLKNGILGIDWIRKMLEPEVDGDKSDPYPYTILAYFLITFQGLIQMNYVILDKVYGVMNKMCSESVIVFILPYIFIFLCLGMLIFNGLYSWILWFTNYEVFSFKREKEIVGSKTRYRWSKPAKNDTSIIWTAFILMCLFFSFFGLGIGVILPCMVVFSGIIAGLSPLFMTAKVEGSGQDYSIFTALQNVVLYKMSVIMYIISLLVVSDAYKAQGAIGALVAIFACVFIKFFYPEIYQQNTKTSTATPGLEKYDIATKTCK
jgi:hypothetical protein